MGNARYTLGDYLNEAEPVATLWPDLIDIVYRENPRHAHPERLGPAARTLFYVGCFSGELINGGMSQFFSNSSGNRTYATLAALRRIGAALCVQLLEKALTVFPDNTAPADRQQRCELLFAFEERNPEFLEQLSKEFHQRIDALGAIPEEDLRALELEFLRANAADPVAA